jgi:SAM-dependent methyltransferase
MEPLKPFFTEISTHRHSTQSLYDSNLPYIDIHGRRYCKSYNMPNDEEEQTRMQMLNSIYYNLLDHRLTTVPLDNPKKILDVGTGIGEWAMAMGEEYPNAEVIGTDIAKIQPTSAPLNVFFEIDDAEEPSGWAWADEEFDLVHFRYMCGAFTSWKHIYQETYRHLKPGGWIEVIDFDDVSPVGKFLDEGAVFPMWLHAIMEGSRRSGRPRTVLHLDPKSLEELGFVDIQTTTVEIPVGVWVEDEQAQRNGKHFLVNVLLGMEAICMRPLAEYMNWTAEEVRDTCERVAQDLWKLSLDPVRSQGFSFKLKILVGRKPDRPQALQDLDIARSATKTEDTVDNE